MDIKDVQLSCNISDSVCFVGDQLWSAEAISNILKNCIEHCPNGGKLEICSAENQLYTEVIISDNGTGFEEKDITHLFDRFYRGDVSRNSATGGSGIGLSIVKKIIEESGYADVRVVATGGLGKMISESTDVIHEYDPMLTMKGLRMIYEKTAGKKA